MELPAAQFTEAATLENQFPFSESLVKSFIITHLHGNLVLGDFQGIILSLEDHVV